MEFIVKEKQKVNKFICIFSGRVKTNWPKNNFSLKVKRKKENSCLTIKLLHNFRCLHFNFCFVLLNFYFLDFFICILSGLLIKTNCCIFRKNVFCFPFFPSFARSLNDQYQLLRKIQQLIYQIPRRILIFKFAAQTNNKESALF